MKEPTKHFLKDIELTFAEEWVRQEGEMYCAAEDCQGEAMHVVIHEETDHMIGWTTPLCAQCKMVYLWGQASPDAHIKEINS